MKHTKGEWNAVYLSPKEIGKRQHIDILVYGQSDKRNGKGTLIVASIKTQPIWNYNHEEAEANAKLIAAAPDLLSACKEALRMYEEIQPTGGWQGVKDELMIAIKKATE